MTAVFEGMIRHGGANAFTSLVWRAQDVIVVVQVCEILLAMAVLVIVGLALVWPVQSFRAQEQELGSCSDMVPRNGSGDRR